MNNNRLPPGVGLPAPNGVPGLGLRNLAPAPAREANRDDHIEILNQVAADPGVTPEKKKDALVSVAHTIVTNRAPAGVVNEARRLKEKYSARNFVLDGNTQGELENDYSDFQGQLANAEGGRRRRGKKSRKPKRKTRSSRASRKAKRYTRRR